jgi:hypothetical protein
MPNTVSIGVTAEDICDALCRHHPAEKVGSYVGRWVCLREFAKIDILALDAWQPADVIGYEVKVSRGDMRSELLDPFKRMEAVSRCTKFYFAIPAGMMTAEEIAFIEPEVTSEDFERVSCPGVPESEVVIGHRTVKLDGKCSNPRHNHKGKSRKSRWIAKDTPRGFSVKVSLDSLGDWSREICPTCNGKGYSELSRVEREFPNLWVPKDVGLVEIDGRGMRVARRSPINKTPKSIIDLEYADSMKDLELANRMRRKNINELARWVSNRPDRRHQ